MKQAFKFVFNFLSFGIPLLIQSVRKEKLVEKVARFVLLPKDELKKESIKSLKFMLTIIVKELENAPSMCDRVKDD